MQNIPDKAAQNLAGLRETKPLVHNITNYVVMNFTANALLAIGASPVMAHAKEEVEEMAAIASALVLNIGTLSPPWIEAMLLAGKKASSLNKPIILDPVGAGATSLRTETAKQILQEVNVTIIRGNASEILALADDSSAAKGVDSIHSVDEAAAHTGELARELQATLAITGAVDLVTDGNSTLRVHNGHSLMPCVTGTGCAATAIIGAFAAADDNPVTAAATALACYGLAGEMAGKNAAGPGSFKEALMDQLYLLDAKMVTSGCRIEQSG
ncbi:MAG: hydroxyethylthiazole kinase [Desulfobulbus propionicus]|nr:MAG: hydroxyethylthiazole kinase [Desulfobulbus propionicus]